MTKILVIGDSFAADWSVKYPVKGWTNFLADKFSVVNLAQAGCSEYKIKKQLDSVNPLDFTHAVVVHTSKSRIPVETHPLHHADSLMHACDFIYSDVLDNKDPNVKCVKEYYEKFYYEDFFDYIYDLIVCDIDKILLQCKIPTLHITFFDHTLPVPHKNFNSLFINCRGNANHINEQANQQVFSEVKSWITS
jgi:hypothetical protein